MEIVKKRIFELVAQHKLSQEDAKDMLLELKKGDSKSEDIAVIGMSCRLPKAKNVGEYWGNLIEGIDCKVDFEKERAEYVKPIVTNSSYSEFLGAEKSTEKEADEFYAGGYLENIDKFDYSFFNIPPKEAKGMDPMQRVLLETVWTAIEDAGYAGDKIYGTNTSVYIGRDHKNDTIYRYITEEDTTHMTGNWPGILAGRINYLYNLKGSALVIDAACSSGLVGVHLASNAMRNKECEMAIVGGVALGCFPKYKKSEISMMESKDFVIRAFDNGANGTRFSEGVAAVILKPLSKALEDGDNVQAIIKGSAINNDGISNGLTAPNPSAQEEVLLKAWENAKIKPEKIQYIEAHGTGTSLGDPIEIKAITNAFKKSTNKLQFCGIGSVKSNIGHTVAVSGLASLIKVVMSMKKNVIPASINFKEPNKFINFTKSPVYVVDKQTKWDDNGEPKVAGISSFGFVGTNCHVVVQEAPENLVSNIADNNKYEVFTLSAKNEVSLKEMILDLKNYLSDDIKKYFKDICFTSNTGRGHYNYRLAIIARNYAELQKKVNAISNKDLNNILEKGVYFGFHKIAPERKKILEANEITESDQKQISKHINELIDEYLSDEEDVLALSELCSLYVKGANANWKKLYKEKTRRIVSIPTYQFEKKICWAEIKGKNKKEETVIKEMKHPLIDRCLVDSIDETIFETVFNTQKDWVLSDHKIMGECVVPGTTYIEMGRKACSSYFQNDFIELKDVIFLTPIVVREKENKLIQTIVRKEKGFVKFTIASKEKEKWVVHAEGSAYEINKPKEVIQFDLDKILKDDSRNRYNMTIKKDKLDSGVFTFGARWLNFREMVEGENEKLVELELSKKFTADLEELVLHPALLDNAANLFIGNSAENVFLPLSYKSFKIYGKMPSHFYAYAYDKNKGDYSGSIKSCDVLLIADTGTVFAEIKDYSLKKANHVADIVSRNNDISNTCYNIKWKEEKENNKKSENSDGTIVVFKSANSESQKLKDLYELKNRRVIEVQIGKQYFKHNDNYYEIGSTEEDYTKLIRDIKDSKICKIIHMSLLGNQEVDTLEKLKVSQSRGVYSLFYVVRAIAANKVMDKIELVLTTEYAAEVTGDEKIIYPHNATLIGFGKSIDYEFKNIRCRAIDIDENTDIKVLYEEIEREAQYYQTALRNNTRYVGELNKFALSSKQIQSIEVKKQGVYLITGGTGGLGLEMAKYLAGKSGVKLALVNRSKLPDRSLWQNIIEQKSEEKLIKKLKVIKDLEASGAEVNLYSADICNAIEMKAVIDDLKSKYGRINGVIHCAGLAGDGFIIRKQKKIFNSVLLPKIEGTWIIDKLTERENLDFTIMFSSMTTLIGGAGQSDYTAANSYLDIFSYYARKLGKKVITINWPAWIETGMAADYGINDKYTAFRSLSTNAGISFLEKIMINNVTNVIPGELNLLTVAGMKDKFPVMLSKDIKTELKKISFSTEDSKENGNDSSNSVEISIKGKGEDYSETEKNLAKMYAAILDLTEIDLYEGFSSMGGDSIMATHLLKLVDEKYPNIVDITDIFSYSSIVELAEVIDKKLKVDEEKQTVEDAVNCSGNKVDTLNTNNLGLEAEIESLLDNLESGLVDIEDGIKILSNER